MGITLMLIGTIWLVTDILLRGLEPIVFIVVGLIIHFLRRDL